MKIEGQNPAYKGYVDPLPFFTTGGEEDTTDTTPTDQFTDAVALPSLSFEVLSEFLNVRNGPGVEFSIVSQLQKGTKIKARRLQSKSVWIEYEPGKWCAIAFNGIVNLKVK